MFLRQILTPVGILTLWATDGALVRVTWGEANLSSTNHNGVSSILDVAECELNLYFAGKLQEFSVPLNPVGTPFQCRVWKALRSVQYGKTATYREIAQKIGSPGASRAVGGANHRNPLPIFIPCHRIIGANGTLTGYAGGLDVKRFLLDFETQNKKQD